MSTADARTPARNGATHINARALRNLALRLAADAADVAPGRVRVDLADAAGSLGVSLTVPLVVDETRPVSVSERSERIRSAVVEGLTSLASRSARPVNIQFSGVEAVRVGRVQ